MDTTRRERGMRQYAEVMAVDPPEDAGTAFASGLIDFVFAEVWSRRTSERAQQVVVGLFPSWAVDKSTVEAADAWLADESHPPALRRLVSEGRAGIVRALGAREFDRS